MEDEDPTCVVKMIKDLRSGSGGFRRNSLISSSLRLSSASAVPSSLIVGDNDDEENFKRTPKRPRIDDSSITLNKSGIENALGSPWEWRRLKGEVIIKKVTNFYLKKIIFSIFRHFFFV